MSFFNPFAPSNSPLTPPVNGDSNIEFGNTPPVDTSKLWYRQDGLIKSGMYWYDGSDWVTINVFKLEFNKRGRLRNGQFAYFGDSLCDETNGPICRTKQKILQISIQEDNTKNGRMNIWSNSTIGSPIGFIDFDGAVSRLNTFATPLIANGLSTISASPVNLAGPGGMGLLDTMITLHYREVYE